MPLQSKKARCIEFFRIHQFLEGIVSREKREKREIQKLGVAPSLVKKSQDLLYYLQPPTTLSEVARFCFDSLESDQPECFVSEVFNKKRLKRSRFL
ncbi:hypothetical protein [Helicobacter sp. 10-6591]|uniref:hypothetical protein n=1 Tax=Helicobacter sp. 10-6591 TaxID=2004998 RepID=UPI000DCB1F64|nr:hypothetical protein [Helicobacter sp. 10-6591]RAX53783.1 hypothetical protein CCY97_06850 [Helicobacter sp. 10-6591]